jgi:hypothetical protein
MEEYALLDIVDSSPSGPSTAPAEVPSETPAIVPRTPAEQLIDLIDSGNTFDTASFLRDIINFAIVSNDPYQFLNRFLVQQISHCKEFPSGYQHELLIVQFIDTGVEGSRPPTLLFLERTASPERLTSYFSDHRDSGIVLKSIVEVLKEMHADRQSTHSTYQMVGESEPPTPSPKLPMFDAATLKAAKFISGSMSSLSKVYKADDRFSGATHLKDYADQAHNIGQIIPTSLTLFEFAVLADAVHNHDPLYSMLRSQCYWFARTMCDVVAKEYRCTVISGTQAPLTVDDISIPANDYLPDMSGRCLGVLISRVEDTVSSAIALNFRKYLQEKHEEVCFFIKSEPYLLKFRYRYDADGMSFIQQNPFWTRGYCDWRL